jgi:hypothetical protein
MLGEQSYTVTRTSGNYVAGDFVVSSSSTFVIRGSLQPLRGTDLDSLPEGERAGGLYKLYSTSTLRTSGTPGQMADTISVNGKALQVRTILGYQNHVTGLPHTKYLLGEPGREGV